MAQCGSLENLIKNFRGKLSRVETGVKFLDVLNYSAEGALSLKDVCESINELQAMNKIIRIRINLEKENLEKLKAQHERLREVRCSVNHIYCNLPEDVRLHDKENPAMVPCVAKSLTVAGESSDVSKDNQKPKKASAAKAKCIKVLQPADFTKIPRHVKGHLKLEQINIGICEINTMLTKKYQFLKRPTKTLSRADLKRRSHYLEMAKDLKGTPYEVFFMDDDIQRHGTIMKTKPKTRDGVLLVLRHFGKLKEVTKGKPSRYCVLGG